MAFERVYQALPAFSYYKQQKAEWGPGNEARPYFHPECDLCGGIFSLTTTNFFNHETKLLIGCVCEDIVPLLPEVVS